MHRLIPNSTGWTCDCGSGWQVPADLAMPAIIAWEHHVAQAEDYDTLDVFKGRP